MAEKPQEIKTSRRDFLFVATAAMGAAGMAGALWPFVSQMNPDSKTLASGEPVELDLAPIAEGQIVKLFWRGKLIFVRHRTQKEIEEARGVSLTSLPDPQADSDRVKTGHEKWLVVYGTCTHLGCVPLGHQGEYQGWFCPCHGSVFDTSGRIRKGPAPTNLPVPPYVFTNDAKIMIG